MKSSQLNSVVLVTFGVVLLLGSVHGEDTDWDRAMDSGNVAMARQHYAEAETSYREALAIAEKRWKKDARIAAPLLKLAEACSAQGKREDVEPLAHRSVTAMEEALKAHKPKNASDEYKQVNVSTGLFDKVGDLLAANQNYLDAENMYQRVIEGWERYVSKKRPSKPSNEDFFGAMIQDFEDAPGKLATAEVQLADLYQREGKSKEADTLYKRAAEIREKQNQESISSREKLYPLDNPRTAQLLNDLAASEARQGHYSTAEPIFKRVIQTLEKSEYKDKSQMATALENYALLLKKTEREAEAKPLLDRADLIRTNSFSDKH